MKDVTLREFIEIAKDNNELKGQVADCVKATRGGKFPDDLLNLAAGAGYNIINQNLAGLANTDKGQLLSDDMLANVSGGIDPLVAIEDLCEFILSKLGYDPKEHC